MAKTKKKPANGEKRVKVVLVPLPEPHRGKIPREEIRRAVQKVISERTGDRSWPKNSPSDRPVQFVHCAHGIGSIGENVVVIW